jgi:hypothetical protein
VYGDWIDMPLGMLTLLVMCAACLLVHGAVADKKLLVHPESSIAVSSIVAVNMVGVQSKFNANWSNLRSITLATPPRHSFPRGMHLLVSVLSRFASGARVVLVNLMIMRPTMLVVVH